MNYLVEFATIAGPQRMRIVGIFEAPSDAAALDIVQATVILRHDQKIQCDVYERNGSWLGRKVWSGLHHPPVGRPRLSVVA